MNLNLPIPRFEAFALSETTELSAFLRFLYIFNKGLRGKNTKTIQ